MVVRGCAGVTQANKTSPQSETVLVSSMHAMLQRAMLWTSRQHGGMRARVSPLERVWICFHITETLFVYACRCIGHTCSRQRGERGGPPSHMLVGRCGSSKRERKNILFDDSDTLQVCASVCVCVCACGALLCIFSSLMVDLHVCMQILLIGGIQILVTVAHVLERGEKEEHACHEYQSCRCHASPCRSRHCALTAHAAAESFASGSSARR